MIRKTQVVGLVSLSEVQEIIFMNKVILVGERSMYLGKISRYKNWKKILDKENVKK